jgi:hypothetical protein
MGMRPGSAGGPLCLALKYIHQVWRRNWRRLASAGTSRKAERADLRRFE